MRYILGVLGVIAALIIVFFLIFRGGNNQNQTPTTPATLVSYADKNSSVSLTTYGRLVGEQERRAIRVTVTPNERRFEVLSGYGESVTTLQTYQNTQEAYANFLSALNRYGFTEARKSSITDQRGVCPTGNRFDYTLSENGDTKSSLWSVSCDSSGTFAGRAAVIRDLFQRQIPDYNAQARPVQL